MIIWKSFNSETGEEIEFCCNILKTLYGTLLTWDPADGKWCVLVRRKTVQHNPYISKNVELIEKDKMDLLNIEYCPFCGKNVYKDELRYDTTGPGWGGIQIAGMSGRYIHKDYPHQRMTYTQESGDIFMLGGLCGLCLRLTGKIEDYIKTGEIREV